MTSFVRVKFTQNSVNGFKVSRQNSNKQGVVSEFCTNIFLEDGFDV